MSYKASTDDTRISDISELADHLAQGCKPASEWRVGAEQEMLGWLPDLNRPPSYAGPRGIQELFCALAADNGWTAVREGSTAVALFRDQASITIEPGGQLELAGAPFTRLADNVAELDADLAEIRRLSERFGMTWSGLGYAPLGRPTIGEIGPPDAHGAGTLARLEDPVGHAVEWMPKARYAIMKRYLPTRGRLALNMMGLTCTVQANYDFSDEADAMEKLRVALKLQPLVIAMFANSAIAEGKLTRYRSFRAAIWEEVDPDRCLLPPRFFEPGARFIDYVSWALGVPMFFIARDGRYVECAGLRFRDFIEHGLGRHRATMGDWELHLSTLFPDVRLKQYLEVRGADMGSRAHAIALSAFHKGILYDTEALRATAHLLDRFSTQDFVALRKTVPIEGFGATLGSGGVSVRELCGQVLGLARAGLGRIDPGAEGFLDVLDAEVEAGESQADRARAAWRGDGLGLLAASRVA